MRPFYLDVITNIFPVPVDPETESHKFYWAVTNGWDVEPENIVEMNFNDFPLEIQAMFWSVEHKPHCDAERFVVVRDESGNYQHDIYFQVNSGHCYSFYQHKWMPETRPIYVAEAICSAHMSSEYATPRQRAWSAAMADAYWNDRD